MPNRISHVRSAPHSPSGPYSLARRRTQTHSPTNTSTVAFALDSLTGGRPTEHPARPAKGGKPIQSLYQSFIEMLTSTGAAFRRGLRRVRCFSVRTLQLLVSPLHSPLKGILRGLGYEDAVLVESRLTNALQDLRDSYSKATQGRVCYKSMRIFFSQCLRRLRDQQSRIDSLTQWPLIVLGPHQAALEGLGDLMIELRGQTEKYRLAFVDLMQEQWKADFIDALAVFSDPDETSEVKIGHAEKLHDHLNSTNLLSESEKVALHSRLLAAYAATSSSSPQTPDPWNN